MGDSLLALIHYRAAISRNRYESNSTTVPQANHTSSPNETALFLRMYINCCDTNIALGKIVSNCKTAQVERYLKEACPAVSFTDMYLMRI